MRNNARRIWVSTPQNCATTNRICYSFQPSASGIKGDNL